MAERDNRVSRVLHPAGDKSWHYGDRMGCGQSTTIRGAAA